MGEAKRRALLDPNFGKVPHLSTTTIKERHAEEVLDELFTCFPVELKELITAQSFPDNYSHITEQISNWLNHRLLKYYPTDRQYIAQYVIGSITYLICESVVDRGGTQNEVSLVFFCCFFKATKNHLPPESLRNLAAKLDSYFVQRRTEYPLSIFEESIYQELQQQLTPTTEGTTSTV